MKNLSAVTAVIVTLTFVMLTGCAGLHPDTVPTTRPEPPKICHQIDVAEPIDPREACPSWRRIALKTDPESECPDPGSVSVASEEGDSLESWKVKHLFTVEPSVAEEASAEYAASLPPALRPFCLYEYKTNAPQILEQLNAKLDSLISTERESRAFERIDFSCVAVSPASDAPSQELSRAGLEAYFLSQIGNVEPVTALGQGSPDGDPQPRVRLSFLDTHPYEEGKSVMNPKSRHGLALSQIARKIACDEPEETTGLCAAEIDYRLALPIERFNRFDPEDTSINDDLGGFSGFIDILATSVWDAVREQESSPRQHLVLNLSVAWDGELFGGLEDEVAAMPVTAQAMHRALEVASCRGALVVAAAGNLRGRPSAESGPLLPGGWELRDAPTNDACREILGLENEARGSQCALSEPLIYAAGGVRFDNSPLYNARPGGTPPRVAYASHASAGGSGKPLTGTSVGTAVISTTAAVVWHHWPYLTRAELMDLLYRAGEPIGRDADFYHRSFGERPEASRVALCPALARACAELGGTCPGECRATTDEPPPRVVRQASCSQRIDAEKITEELENIPFCGDRRILYDPAKGIPTDPCPSKQFFGTTAKSWDDDTLPQPEDDPCMGCDPATEGGGFLARKVGQALQIVIDPQWKKTLSHAFLDIDDYSLSLGVGELEASGCVLVENLDLDRFANPGSYPYVILRFRTEDRRAVSVPLLF